MISLHASLSLFPYSTLFRSESIFDQLTELSELAQAAPPEPEPVRETEPPAAAKASPKAPAKVVKKPDRKSTRLNSSHGYISYAAFCLKTKRREVVQHIMYSV